MSVTRDQLEDYVCGLSEDMQTLFQVADLETNTNPDTLSEEFQVAAAVVEVYRGRAAQQVERRSLP